ncbi:MAG: thiamine pyrophosphate-dependent enzyme, partial [Vicinamibacterales bacterium]|nr:thiamine pyrophosphate-dependent enzyme [Vicinamibacterales bacterium]
HFKARDCIERLKNHIVETGIAGEAELQAIDDTADAAVNEAVRFADESPFPDIEELFTDVYISYPEQKLTAGAASEMIGSGGRSG